MSHLLPLPRHVKRDKMGENDWKMGVDDWDIIGQCTASLMTATAVVKQTEGDEYPTISLVLSFMNSCMRSLSKDVPI